MIDKFRVVITPPGGVLSAVRDRLGKQSVAGLRAQRALQCDDTVRAVYETDEYDADDLEEMVVKALEESFPNVQMHITVKDLSRIRNDSKPTRVGPPVETIDDAYEYRELRNITTNRS